MIDFRLYILASFEGFSLFLVLSLGKQSRRWLRSVWPFADRLSGVDCGFDINKCRVVVGHQVEYLVLAALTSGIGSHGFHLN